MIEPAITYLLLLIGLVLVARSASTFLDHLITAWRARTSICSSRSGRIHLVDEEGDPKKRPFPRHGLIPVAILALAGIIVQIIMFSLALNNWRSAHFTWWTTQIVFFVIHHVLLILAVIYPYHLLISGTFSIPPSRPSISVKRTRVLTNPGTAVQQLSLILALLPLIASLEPWSWYNKYYWHRYDFNVAATLSVIQPVFAGAIFVYGTVVRQIYGDGEEKKPEIGFVSVARIEEGRVAAVREEEREALLEGSEVDVLEVVESLPSSPVLPKATSTT